MKYGWVEDILGVFYALEGAVESYQAINLTKDSGFGPRGGSFSVPTDLIFVIDVGKALDRLENGQKRVLLLLYGHDFSLRKTAKKLRSHPEAVKRKRNRALEALDEDFRDRGIRLARPQMRHLSQYQLEKYQKCHTFSTSASR